MWETWVRVPSGEGWHNSSTDFNPKQSQQLSSSPSKLPVFFLIHPQRRPQARIMFVLCIVPKTVRNQNKSQRVALATAYLKGLDRQFCAAFLTLKTQIVFCAAMIWFFDLHLLVGTWFSRKGLKRLNAEFTGLNRPPYWCVRIRIRIRIFIYLFSPYILH
jgi:hypothetical protein